MKPHTFNTFNIAGLLSASIARHGFSESTRIRRRPDPERQALAEIKRHQRRQRNLWIQSRGGYRG